MSLRCASGGFAIRVPAGGQFWKGEMKELSMILLKAGGLSKPMAKGAKKESR